MIVLLAFVLFIGALVGGAAMLHLLAGPDLDLGGEPWDPRR